jgi:hypothetical protein
MLLIQWLCLNNLLIENAVAINGVFFTIMSRPEIAIHNKFPIENNFETIILNAFQRLNQHINILFVLK